MLVLSLLYGVATCSWKPQHKNRTEPDFQSVNGWVLKIRDPFWWTRDWTNHFNKLSRDCDILMSQWRRPTELLRCVNATNPSDMEIDAITPIASSLFLRVCGC